MRISKISYPVSVNNIKNYQQKSKNITIPINTDKSILSEGVVKYPNYYTLIPFGNSTKQSEYNEKYFQLPQGCKPDKFQVESALAISKGNDLIADAPTGTGKTAIAHYAASKNMAEGKKTFYTTPLKALSNQKYNEFKSVYGEENVGLLTGDRRENTAAPILIMTTEVYRNMALSNMYGETSDLMDNLKTVILDEFHYLDDPSRGAVWEEAKMFTPKDVQTVALSATFGNPEELINWFNNDKTSELVSLPSSQRNVPLEYGSIMTNSYKTEEKIINKNLRKGTITQFDYIPSKPTLSDFKYAVEKLNKKEQLPAIIFVFSRNFSRDLLNYLGQEGEDLTTKQEKEEIEKILNKYEEKEYIGEDIDKEALSKGYAIHNAGIIPKQKEMIEELFQKKLVKVVIATETLAAGINMPAKTVVISSPFKPGDTSEEESPMRLLTANEFKQMSGRAGRRGIDTIGYVYTMPTNKVTEQDFLYLEATDCNSLESKYNPSYDFLAGYYEKFNDNGKLTDIFDKTFYAYSDDSSVKDSKIQSLLDLSSKKTNVLTERGILEKDKNGEINPTILSNMASKVRGYDVLTLTETLADKNTFANMSPAAVAMTAGAIANPAGSKDKEITLDTDLYPIFNRTAQSVENIYTHLNSSVNSIIKKLGKDPEKFNNFDEMLAYAEGIEEPKDSISNLRMELRKQEARRAKMYTITKSSGNYTTEEVVNALKKGEVVPTKVLEQYSDTVEKYKDRINAKSIEDYADKIRKEIEEQDTSKKGNKAKARVERKISDLTSELNNAEMMQYLDDNLMNAISSNYQFIKKNPPQQVKQDFYNANELYYESKSKDILINKIKALMYMQENIQEDGNIEADITADCKNVTDCFKNLKNKSLEINSCEIRNGLKEKPQEYNKTAAQILYTWTYLNSVNPVDTMENWEQLLKIISPNDADEGTIYRTIMQTADLLSQMQEMAEIGYNSSENEDDKAYWANLKNSSKQARSLIIKEPVEI